MQIASSSVAPAPPAKTAKTAKTDVALAALSLADAHTLLGRVKQRSRGLGASPLAEAIAHLERAIASLAHWEESQTLSSARRECAG